MGKRAIGFGIAAVAALAMAAPGATTASSDDPPTVAILNLANVPSLTEMVDGVIDGLAAAGYSGDAIRIDSQNANGDLAVAQSIAAKFVEDRPDVIVTITTPSLQSAVNATRERPDLPIVFGAVSDPVAAGAVDSIEGATGTNVTGVYNTNPIPDVLDLALEMMPDLESVGIIYNPGEDNSVADAAVLRAAAAERDIEVVEATADNSNNVQTAALSIVDRVDAVILMQDTTVATAQEVVNRAARDAGIPVFAFDASLVENGALAGLGRSPHDTGAQMAELVVQIIEGTAPGEIELQPVNPAKLLVNLDAAEATGFVIPAVVLERADTVIGGESAVVTTSGAG